ncbi:MAG: fructosamine kinase family protein [Microcoleus sp. PH2017_10_PVI_O_A]|uniref:fructosamine kinase family protein n=1 Tax=unclassified Microcoleus TaxID=2642155 RepID=UPI001D5DB032|nr:MULTISPECIES: fructosamine kinase family protein [unclassified Microcoleus]TAE79662.1 MAG: fructosamine kinase family protein [Oscillatoriales cyanobacterium]MCC3408024.1 fructosamine kinase family protein [Microcoleus sp. PH2017_10_PVI_O_A]MCC3460102.1 fructosamine kinase family protein [Microcoleus sp. PH2017_11_PCY_U_A]MCC3480166.1 fructosamine kinase family protein [Microcoleus sp. PH2017_12_PCY_D_A]MCC3528015.1 fructosamine kinase family protein [Microcoleus sp. PH2017_21_RUC_O_A]
MWHKIAAHISETTGESFSIDNRRSVSGGCINQGYAINSSTRTYFAKINQASQAAMFEAEALGLQQMAETQTIRVPQPICWGTEGNSAYIVLEWLDLRSGGGDKAWEEMGRKLAQMHQFTPPSPPWLRGGEEVDSALLKRHFGWSVNNAIGSTSQINKWTADWAEFWTEHRIGYQLKLARRRGGNFNRGETLLAAIPKLLEGYKPQPSLVHGDLWGGNASVTAAGEPVIFDPAAYWGDREVDIAMTELFGGFSAAFYRGYNEVWLLDSGYEKRKKLYNLYHILNHFNLFGGSYESQANQTIDRILS